MDIDGRKDLPTDIYKDLIREILLDFPYEEDCYQRIERFIFERFSVDTVLFSSKTSDQGFQSHNSREKKNLYKSHQERIKKIIDSYSGSEMDGSFVVEERDFIIFIHILRPSHNVYTLGLITFKASHPLEIPLTFYDMEWLALTCAVVSMPKKTEESDEISDNQIQKDELVFSKSMSPIIEFADRAARTDSPILIMGESGSGKEVLAHRIHQSSQRADGPFTALNCAAIPAELLEVELMGFMKGSFTDASEDRAGKLELTQGGTLFLDEIGDMALPLQAKLLRVLENKEVQRLGGKETIHLDIRIIAATNHDLSVDIKKETFRKDLYYRLNVFTLQIPPLRERLEDIVILANHFLRSFGDGNKRFSPEAIKKLITYSWPGNIRELKNVVERTALLVPDEIISTPVMGNNLVNDNKVMDQPKKYKEALILFKKQLIESSLEMYNGNQTQAAKALGLQRTYLARLITELNIR